MRQVFITNLEPESLGEGKASVAFQKEAGTRVPDIHIIQALKWPEADEAEVVYVIDVHFQYKRGDHVIKLQEQGGVDVYRHLLAHYVGKSEPLRVVFYSPIPKEVLVRLRPENYVLHLLPFAEGAYSEDFAGALDRIIAEQNWPQFNNASENLLCGWALANKEGIRAGSPPEPIATDGHKVLVIDDEMPQWQTALKAVIGAHLTLLHYDKSAPSDGAFAFAKLGDGAEEQIRAADLILSDLYLEERHETTRWMSGEQLQDISGFKLFDLVKGTEDERGWNPGVPYILHTSSNKVSYFRHFQSQGLDGWFVKDIRANAPSNEKQAHYELFAKGLKDTLTGDNGMLYTRLTTAWQSIHQLEEREHELWWHGRYAEVGIVINTLKAVWLGVRAFVGRTSGQYDRLGTYDELVIVPAAYISLLGQLSEAIEVEENYQNYVFKALKSIRHCGAHFQDRSHLLAEDVVLYLELWILVLNAKDIDNSLLKRHRDGKANHEENPRFVNVFREEYYDQSKRSKEPRVYLKNQLLCTYLQLYNYDHGQGLAPMRPALERRIAILFKLCDKTSLVNDITKHAPLVVTVEHKPTRSTQNILLKGLDQTIGYGLSMDQLNRKGVRLDAKNNKMKVVHG